MSSLVACALALPALLALALLLLRSTSFSRLVLAALLTRLFDRPEPRRPRRRPA